jgi:ribosomal protein S18 acetylase RimI-like enzyme
LIPEKDSPLIENIAVQTPEQRKGIGRKLMEFAEEEASRLSLDRMRLYSNEVMIENIGFYNSLDYSETDRRTEDGYLMSSWKRCSQCLPFDASFIE